MLNISKIRTDFPIFKRTINGKPIIYLDSTASSLKPRAVINAQTAYYENYSANIFRGIYTISQEATQKYEQARKIIARFIGVKNVQEIIFVRNATEAINLIASTWGEVHVTDGSEIVSTVMEHHANIVPWQELAVKKRAIVKYLDISDDGHLKLSSLDNIINSKTKIFACTYISNVLGTVNPIKKIISLVKKINPKIITVIDGAQAIPHSKVNVSDLGCDFFVFSGHKMLGPTGIGVLWGKYGLLKDMPPYQLGGEMITEVRLDKTTFKDPPHKFEAGTPHIAGAIGLAAAVKYLENIGMDKIQQHEFQLTQYMLEKISPLAKIYGPQNAHHRAAILAFNIEGVHPHDLAQILDRDNICIRSGHHCAMPLHERLGTVATARASCYLYNSQEDIDALVRGVLQARKIFKI